MSGNHTSGSIMGTPSPAILLRRTKPNCKIAGEWVGEYGR